MNPANPLSFVKYVSSLINYYNDNINYWQKNKNILAMCINVNYIKKSHNNFNILNNSIL